MNHTSINIFSCSQCPFIRHDPNLFPVIGERYFCNQLSPSTDRARTFYPIRSHELCGSRPPECPLEVGDTITFTVKGAKS